MKVLVIGGGGREHALAWKLARSPAVATVYVAPGNAGTAGEPKVENVPIGASDIEALREFALTRAVDLTVVGPEAPLVAGIVDRFAERGLRIFGPSAAAARIEGSKAFTKGFLERHGIPTAGYREFTDPHAAHDHVRARGAPIVVKADGLAAGKGVVVARDVAEAIAAIDEMLSGDAFGDAGRRVVIEDFLEGEEASFICIVGRGGAIVPLASSQDHKPAFDGDTGPNTGGMGAYSPAPVVDAAMHERIMRDIVRPTVRGLAEEGSAFVGFLYAGLMIGPDGVARVIEFNCRLGDPEAQPILMRMQADLPSLCAAAVDGGLGSVDVAWDPRVALGVVMAAGGYPQGYETGARIEGLDDVPAGTKVFHAGTAAAGEAVVTAGGRVLCACGLGADVAAAQSAAYRAVRRISWPGAFYRTDIGYRAVARTRGAR